MKQLILAVSFVAICSHIASAQASKQHPSDAHKSATSKSTPHAAKAQGSHHASKAIKTIIETKHHSEHHAHHSEHHAHSHQRSSGQGGAQMASWYGNQFHGKPTSSGEIYNMYGFTAAHRTLPLRSYAKVTNLRNHRSVVVRINDRGGFHGKRAMDLSYAAAKEIGITGVAAVAITPLGFD